jgi:hypothetical protein
MDVVERVVGGNTGSLTAKELKAVARAVSEELAASKAALGLLREQHAGSLQEYRARCKELKRRWKAQHPKRLCALVDMYLERLGDSSTADFIAEPTGAECKSEQDYQLAAEAALSEDHEVHDGVDFGGQQWCVREALLPFLQAQPSPEATRLYVSLFMAAHGEQLKRLPHAAALFFSECRLLADKMLCDDVKDTGAVYLQQHIESILAAISCFQELGGAVFIDDSNVGHLIERPLEQLLLQLERFYSVCHLVLKPHSLADVLARSMIVMTRSLLSALFSVILRASCVLACFRQPIADVIELHECHEPGSRCAERLKLNAVRLLIDKDLLAWIGSFRKRQHPLSAAEYAVLIRSHFSDSSLRVSCLRELEAAASDEHDDDHDHYY